MGSKRRLSEQQQQEYRSRDQLADRFDDYGWVPDPISRDLGEDFIVQIYDEGVSSGLAFFVQLKSVGDLERFEIRGDYISYRLEVKDLVHWDASAIPVFVIIWDVNRRVGCWISVHDVSADLNGRKPNWRNQKTVRVRIPRSDSTNDEGLCRIRQSVAYYYYPLVSKGRSLEISGKLAFPDTVDGRAAREALEQHFAAGDLVEIDGQFIQELEFSEWWMRLFGETDLTKGKIELGTMPSKRSAPVRLDLASPNGVSACVPYVDLKVIKRGSSEFTVSNDHQPIPTHFQFTFRQSEQHFGTSVRITGPGTSVQETRDLLSLMEALARGGKIRMTYLATGETIEGLLPEGQADAPNPAFVGLVDKLCLVQQKTGQILTLGSLWSITAEDAERADELMTILETGQVAWHDATVTGRFKKPALDLMLEAHQAGRPVKLKITSDDSYVEVLRVRISLGPATRYMSGVMDIPAVELERAISNMGTDDEMEINLVNAEVVKEFANWLPRTEENSKTH
jgi:hypothetical protein